MGTDQPRSRRHRRTRAVLITLGVLLTVVVVAAGLGVWTVTRSFPTLSGKQQLAGLSAEATVYRDAAGIPQIEAKTPKDLFMAEGFVHAQDRFWEMDFRRHVTSGRLSELFGGSQVGTDTFIRTLGWRAVAEQEVKLLDPVTLSYYQAYADGVNAYLKTHQGADLSLEYAVLGLQRPGYKPEPWVPADSIAWLKAMAWDLRSNLDDEIDRAILATTLAPAEVATLHPDYPYATHPTILDGMPTAAPATAEAQTDAPASDSAGAGPAAAGSTAAGSAAAGPAAAGSAAAGPAAAGSAAAGPAAAGPAALPAAPGSAAAGPAALPAAGTAQTQMLASLASVRSALASVPELLGPAGGEIGSNSWVVSGAHTDTGKPILANDPHLGPLLPSVWYQVGLRCSTVSTDCPFELAGYSFSGMPGVIIGHNARVAWGFTNLGPDVADLFLEKVSGDTYEYDGVQKPLTVRNEKITVAGGDPVKIEIRSTEHGPIISGLEGTAFPGIASDYPAAAGLPTETAGTDTAAAAPIEYELSLQWTALTPGRTASAIFALGAATDWATFRQAAQLFEVPSQNLLYADVDGNIGYQAPGLIPIRAAGDGTVPMPGWSSAYGWTGYIPFDALPQTYNPPSGVIVTANNAPVGADYPYLITKDWDLGYRADQIMTRLQTLISSKVPITTDTMSEIQADNYSAIAAVLVPVLQKITVSGDAKKAQALFDGWDYKVDAGSAASAYFNIVWRNLLVDLFGDKLPDGTALTGGHRAFAVVTALLDDPSARWWTSERIGSAGRDTMLARALVQAAKEGTRLMGSNVNNWKWGSIHTLELRNASFGESGVAPIEWLFNRGPYEMAGASSVVNAVGWDATVGYGVNWVPSMRQVISLADFDDSTWVNLTGASGHAFHPNYTDQTPLWQNHKTRAWPFSQTAVKKAAKDTLTLTPSP